MPVLTTTDPLENSSSKVDLKPKPEAHKGIHSQRSFRAVTNSRFIFWGAIVALITATVVSFGVSFAWLVTSKPPSVGRFVVVSVLVVAAVSMILATVVTAISLLGKSSENPAPRD